MSLEKCSRLKMYIVLMLMSKHDSDMACASNRQESTAVYYIVVVFTVVSIIMTKDLRSINDETGYR